MTPQRKTVIDVIARWRGSFTAIEVYDRARKDSPGVGLATIYRTIELLKRSGAVKPLSGGEPGEYVRCHLGHHHHLVCLSCGSVEETELCAAPSPRELKRKHGFAAERHEFDVYGTCARCAAA